MRILSYAIDNIFHSRWLSLSSLLVLSLLIFFINIFLFLIYGTDYFIHSINKRIVFSLNFKEGFTSEDVRVVALFDEVQKNFSGSTIQYISASWALEVLRLRDPQLAALIEDDHKNPLPNTLQIENIPLDQYDDLNAIIPWYQDIIEYDREKMERKLLSYQSQYERIASVVSFMQSMQFSILILVLLFCMTVGIIAYLIIGNSIFFHRNEIQIIELVGGGGWFLYWPFILQSVFYTTLSALVAVWALFWLFSSSLLVHIFSTQNLDLFLSDFLHQILLFLPWEFLLFLLVGILSGYLAAQKYTKKMILSSR